MTHLFWPVTSIYMVTSEDPWDSYLFLSFYTILENLCPIEINLYYMCLLALCIQIVYATFIQILSITVIFVIVAVSRSQKLKLSLEHEVGRWTFKGWGSTDFKGGWGGGIGVGFRFNRSTHAVCITRYHCLKIQINVF